MRSTLLDSPAAAATRAATPVTLPGVTGAPRLAARVRLARGTLPPPPPPTEATIAALADVRALETSRASTDDVRAALADVRAALACSACERAMADAYSCIGAGGWPGEVTP